jgi:hypothetical protein
MKHFSLSDDSSIRGREGTTAVPTLPKRPALPQLPAKTDNRGAACIGVDLEPRAMDNPPHGR